MSPTNAFNLSPDICYLNHAAVSPWPRRTVEAVTRFAEENGRRGSEHYARWLSIEEDLRGRLATLINAPSPRDIALAKNTSEALSIIAYGIDWREGDNVVGIAEEFPSNRIVWESLSSRGVDYRQLNLYRSSAPEEDLMALCDDRTRLIAVSSVQYARGLRLDLEVLGNYCRSHDILLGVDAIQHLGAAPFDLERTAADFVVADGHKWMLGPEGIALLYVNPAIRPRLSLHQFGWHMTAQPGDYERSDWQPAADARRFECGSPNMLGIHALNASLSLLIDEGLNRVQTLLQQRIDRLIELVDAAGFELLSPRGAERRAGIVTFRVPDVPLEPLHKDLVSRKIMCAQRGGGIRFSPHFYTPMEALERAVAAAEDLALRGNQA